MSCLPDARTFCKFQVEQILFGPEASAVAGQVAVAADDAVAGEDDGDGVGAVGIGHSPDGFGESDGGGQFTVGHCLSVGDVGELLPDALLEVGAGQQEGDVEVRRRTSGRICPHSSNCALRMVLSRCSTLPGCSS